MGQKVNPESIRLKINKTWRSKWFDKAHYQENLISDLKIRKYLNTKLKTAAVARIDIIRDANKLVINIFSGRPGLIIGRKGTGTDDLKQGLIKHSNSKLAINIVEIKKPDMDAAIIGQNVAVQIEKRIPFKRAIKQSLERAKEAGALGVKIQTSGRLNGAEIARSEKSTFGTVPLSSFKSDIDYCLTNALTTYGIIGIKVWVYRGEGKYEE